MDRLSYADIARIFGTGLIATGLGLLLFVAITVAWGDPFTKLSANQAQDELQRQIATFDVGVGPLRSSGISPDLTRVLARQADKSTGLGDAAGKIRLPSIDVRTAIVNGARTDDLKKGPGIYEETGFPGSGAPVAIAGHRTTYGAPFLNLDRVKAGDPIIVDVAYGRFTYTVTRSEIIDDHDWSIIKVGAAETNAGLRRQAANGRCRGTCEHLVLTACHPKHSAAQRIAVYAKLTNVELRGGAA